MKDTKAMGNTGAFQQMEKCEPFPAQSVWGPVGPQWGDKGYLVTCPGGHHEQGSWRGPQMALCNQTPVCPLQYIAIMASGACFALEGLVLQRRVQESWACLVLMYGNVYDLSKLAYLNQFLPCWNPFSYCSSWMSRSDKVPKFLTVELWLAQRLGRGLELKYFLSAHFLLDTHQAAHWPHESDM